MFTIQKDISSFLTYENGDFTGFKLVCTSGTIPLKVLVQ